MSFSKPKHFGKNERGSATIEFVVTMPLFLAALAFAFEFGQFFLAHQATVNNVRSAARYLSRTSMSTADVNRAIAIVRTGRPLALQGAALDDAAPDYLKSANATVDINTAYSTFSSPTFSRDGQTLRIKTRVNFPLTIFGFAVAGSGGTMPFVVVEDLRHVGI